MTIHIDIGEAKTRLAELVAAATQGEDVVVSEAGEPRCGSLRLRAIRPLAAEIRATA